MLFFFLGIVLAYCFFVLVLIVGWQRATKASHVPCEESTEIISVLIPVRNEVMNIGALLNDLCDQTDRSFEVIVIDDHSEDHSAGLVRAIKAAGFENLRLLTLRGEAQGKKQALTLGVRQAKGSIIVATDADCRVSAHWITSFRKVFANPKVMFAFGAVRIRQDGTRWSSLQAMEFASLVGTGAASNAWGYPTFCNGANMAYRIQAFEEVDGYVGNEQVASGDDEFLLRKIVSRFPGSIAFVNDKRNVVETNGVSLRGFVQQRVRWAGKWPHQHLASKLMALLIFFFHISYLFMLIWWIVQSNFIMLLCVFFLKSCCEIALLRQVTAYLNAKWNWGDFFIWQGVYSAYAVIFGIAARTKEPTWKGRKIRRSGSEITLGLRQNH